VKNDIPGWGNTSEKSYSFGAVGILCRKRDLLGNP
jgi:hypothetical protein